MGENACAVSPLIEHIQKGQPMRLPSDRRKTPIRGFPDGASALRARFDGVPSNRTLARIEVFFASGSPRQKSDFKARIRGQN